MPRKTTPKKQTLTQRLDYQTRQLAEHQQAIDYLKREVRDVNKEIVELEEILDTVASKGPPITPGITPGPWKPKDEEIVYGIDFYGMIQSIRWSETYKKQEEIGNVFPTREAAEKELKRRKVMKKLKDMAEAAGEIKKMWYYLSYDRQAKMWIALPHEYYTYPGNVRFPSIKSVEQAIKELGAELDVLL